MRINFFPRQRAAERSPHPYTAGVWGGRAGAESRAVLAAGWDAEPGAALAFRAPSFLQEPGSGRGQAVCFSF